MRVGSLLLVTEDLVEEERIALPCMAAAGPDVLPGDSRVLYSPGKRGVAMAVTTRAIDGSTVQLEAPDRDIGWGITSRCVIAMGASRIEAESGDLSFRDDVLRYLDGEIVGSFRAGDARITIGLGARPKELPVGGPSLSDGLVDSFMPPTEAALRYRVAFFESAGRCVKIAGRGATSEELIEVFDAVEVLTDEVGISITPWSAVGARIASDEYSTIVNIPVRNVGLLEIRRMTMREEASLPAWSGSPVAGGEAWVEDGDEFADTSYLIAGESAIARLLPAHAVAGRTAVEDTVASIRFNWSGAT